MAEKSKQMTVNEKELPLLGFGTAPEIFVDGYQGASVVNGVVKIHFYSLVLDPVTQAVSRRVVFTMVCPAQVLASIATANSELVENLKRDGILVQASEKVKADA